MSDGARRGILTAGTWVVDRNRLVATWPNEDGMAEILSEERQGGGSACNLAIDIRRLDPGVPVETAGLVGDDDDGRLLLAVADRYGIDRRHLAMTAEAPTQFADAYTVRASGRRTHIYRQGAGALLTPDHFDFTGSTSRFLHLGLPGVHLLMDQPWGDDANGWVRVLRRARAAGLRTNLELASLSDGRLAELVRPCLPHLDLLVVNDTEIGALAGIATVQDGRTDVGACIAAIGAVMAAGVMATAIVHFPLGAIALTRDGQLVTKPSVRVATEEVVGANGAGDAFAAGLLYGVHEGWELSHAMALAHATAAASLRALSTTAAVGSWRDCLDLAARWGWREDELA